MFVDSQRATQRGLILFLALILCLTGCSAIPTVGPVGTITAEPQDGSLDITLPYSPRGPSDNATPKEIVDGFIAAGRGVQEDYQVAREYLGPKLNAAWSPEERVLIYRAEPKTVQTPKDENVQIQVEVVGSINAVGIRSDTAAGTTETIDAHLTRNNSGQWRISEIPNGILVPEGSVSTLFRSHNLYFYNSTYRYWVPDVRWFVKRQGVTANIIKTMLAGPAPYLEGAVVSAFPEGTTLPSNSVPISSGEATVDLSADILQGATDERLLQMRRQLEQNLSSLNTVYSVEMTTGQSPVSIDVADTPDPVVKSPSVGITQIALLKNELTYYLGAQPVAIPDIPSIRTWKPKDPAIAYDLKTMAFLSGDRKKLLVTAPDQNVRVVSQGQSKTAPSFDPMNWLWHADSSDEGQYRVHALPPGGDSASSVTLSAEWLGDRDVKELRISRDGARALIVAEQAGKSQVLLSGITRSSDGVPRELAVPYEVRTSGPVDAAKWVDETTFVVMDADDDAPVSAEIITLGSSPQETAPLQGMLGISAGTGDQDIFAATAKAIYSRVGNSWVEGTPGIRDPAFPG